MRTPDDIDTGFGQAEIPDLAFGNQILNRTGHILDRHFRIDTMLVKQVDHICLQAFQRRFSHFTDMPGTAVQFRPFSVVTGIGDKAELGGYRHVVAEGAQALHTPVFHS